MHSAKYTNAEIIVKPQGFKMILNFPPLFCFINILLTKSRDCSSQVANKAYEPQLRKNKEKKKKSMTFNFRFHYWSILNTKTSPSSRHTDGQKNSRQTRPIKLYIDPNHPTTFFF